MILVVFAGLLFLGSASADTYVDGGVSGYVTWSSANNPYRLSSDVIVYSGNTLNIQAGTIVHLNGYQIQVYGTLNVQGSSSNKVYFLNDGNSNSQIYFTSSSSSNCAINYGVFYSVPIMIGGGAPTISNSYFTACSSTTITVNGGYPLITGNTINAGSQNCITLNGGSAIISSNTLAGSGHTGNFGIYNSAGSISVVGNSITNCYTGIYSAGSGTIEQNTIMNNFNDAVKSNNDNHNINNNVLAYNKVGVSGDGDIQNNAITNNQYGLWGTTSGSTVTNNNIYDNDENVHLTEKYLDVNATNNWWGTTNNDLIYSKISDYHMHPEDDLGTLYYTPYLNQPASAPFVPSSIPVPTAPPTPTVFSSPSPSPSPTNDSTITPTPSPTPYYTYNPTPYPYQTNNPTPYYVNTPTPPVDFGGFTLGDITNVLVIVVAVSAAVVIIVIIHRRFSRSELPPPPDFSNSYS